MIGLETILVSFLTMLGIAFCYGWVLLNIQHAQAKSIAVGTVFGLGVICTMSTPIIAYDWSIVDLRTVLVGFALVLSGWAAGAVAVVFGLSYELLKTGSLLTVGSFAILLGFSLGGLWRIVASRAGGSPLVLDAAFGALSAAILVLVYSAVNTRSFGVAGEIAVFLLVVHVVGAIALGHMSRSQVSHISEAEQLRQFAELDPLTLLLNRRGTTLALERVGSRQGRGRALLYFDIDHFKSINDRHGHLAGDAALAAVAERIKGVLRDDVIFSRHGGDEFTLYFPNIAESIVPKIAERVRACIRDSPIAVQGQDLDLSISIGAYWTETYEAFDTMLMCADMALLQAKAMGRDQVSLGWMQPLAQAGASQAGPRQALH